MYLGMKYEDDKANEDFKPQEYAKSLTVGKRYTVTKSCSKDDSITEKVKVKLIKKYRHFALFDMGKRKESFLYYDLWKMGC